MGRDASGRSRRLPTPDARVHGVRRTRSPLLRAGREPSGRDRRTPLRKEASPSTSQSHARPQGRSGRRLLASRPPDPARGEPASIARRPLQRRSASWCPPRVTAPRPPAPGRRTGRSTPRSCAPGLSGSPSRRPAPLATRTLRAARPALATSPGAGSAAPPPPGDSEGPRTPVVCGALRQRVNAGDQRSISGLCECGWGPTRVSSSFSSWPSWPWWPWARASTSSSRVTGATRSW